MTGFVDEKTVSIIYFNKTFNNNPKRRGGGGGNNGGGCGGGGRRSEAVRKGASDKSQKREPT